MSTYLTDIIHHLQDFHAHHSDTEVRVMVEVPMTRNIMEQFEVEGVHENGPSVVLSCRNLPEPGETARPRERKARRVLYNDYEDLC